MLKKMRSKKFTKRVFWALVIIVVPAFVLLGPAGMIKQKNQAPDFKIKVFSQTVSAQKFQEALLAERNSAIMQFGDNFNQVSRYLNLESRALDRLILLYEAKRRKIKISDAEVIKLIQGYPFLARKGRFDQKTYEDFLSRYLRTSARAFEEETRSSLMIAQVYTQVTNDIKVTDEEVRQAYEKANQELSIIYLAAKTADFKQGITPTDSQIEEYFSRNSLQFKRPLSFNVEYLKVDSQTKAKELLGRLQKKFNLQVIAKELDIPLKDTGLFAVNEPIPGIGWSAQLLEEIGKLKIGQVSTVLQVENNYYVLRLKERKEPYIPDLNEVKDKVRETLAQEEAKKIAREKIESCFKKLEESARQNQSVDLKTIAQEFSLAYNETELFKSGGYLEGIGAADVFWSEARKLKENEFGLLKDMPSGFYIIKLKSLQPIDENKFLNEKEEFSKTVLERKKSDFFSGFMNELRKKGLGS